MPLDGTEASGSGHAAGGSSGCEVFFVSFSVILITRNGHAHILARAGQPMRGYQ